MLDRIRTPLVLASASEVRATLLRNAGLTFEVAPTRVDEEALRAALAEEGASPRDQADALAELKALRVSGKRPDALVIGSDQILEYQGVIFSKPRNEADAAEHLRRLRGQTHRLLSAVVVCRGGEPIWRHVGVARLTMAEFSDGYLADYVARNWQSIRHSVGCYKLEEEGVRLFSRIEGDYFTILGLPLIELLTWLRIRGEIAS